MLANRPPPADHFEACAELGECLRVIAEGVELLGMSSPRPTLTAGEFNADMARCWALLGQMLRPDDSPGRQWRAPRAAALREILEGFVGGGACRFEPDAWDRVAGVLDSMAVGAL